jgi:DNA-binding winged helix-turn-helix (wHTH) protein
MTSLGTCGKRRDGGTLTTAPGPVGGDWTLFETVVNTAPNGPILRFGPFELDTNAELLLKAGRTIRLQPQPFRLLRLLAEMPGRVVTRNEIQAALWKGDTFVDYDQGVNFAIKQVRDALGEDADRPMYIQTVPKRGYRFLAPVEVFVPGAPEARPQQATDLNLHKALWANIAELRLVEARRERRGRILLAAGAGVAVLAAVSLLLMWLW